MLLTIAVIIFILWLLGFVAFHIAGGFIHILLIVAAVVVVWHLLTGRRGV
ncbi:lmo0937 family membrane protein [Candidatus Saccharibacteria bacterium]|nr:lmo0937 family membrane protein [Candidatus Saccharibacteria bacterium]